MADENENTEKPEFDEVPVANAGYAAVPEGFVFVPATTGDSDLLRELLEKADDPEDVITRAGYGYVVPEALAGKVKAAKPQDVATPLDYSTPDTTPAESATDTQDDAGVQDNVGETADGPLVLAENDPAKTPDQTSTSKSSKKDSAAPAAS